MKVELHRTILVVGYHDDPDGHDHDVDDHDHDHGADNPVDPDDHDADDHDHVKQMIMIQMIMSWAGSSVFLPAPSLFSRPPPPAAHSSLNCKVF